nr:hypothetical protein [Tanacetum cinerariifolium]
MCSIIPRPRQRQFNELWLRGKERTSMMLSSDATYSNGDVFFWTLSRRKSGKEVDIRLGEGHDKPLRPADMFLYSWDRGMDVCVDLTWSSPLTQTRMVDFVSGRVVIEAAQRKRAKTSRGKRLAISMVEEAWLSEKKEV